MEVVRLSALFSVPTGRRSTANGRIGKAADIAGRGFADELDELAETGHQLCEVGVLQRPTNRTEAVMRGTDWAVREGEPATGIIVSREFLYFHGDRLSNV
ncbi:hypothetical protein D9M70_585230 [compost metagenome]